jgi:hypothetical protein
MQTPAAPPRKVGRLCRGQRPGRSRYLYVPGTVAIQVCVGLTPRRECPVRSGSRAGRVVGRFLLLQGRCGGGREDLGRVPGRPGTEPVTVDSFVLSPFVPRPTSAALRCTDTAIRNNWARPASHPVGGLPGLRPKTPDADSRSSDNGLSSLGLAPSALVRRRLAGRPGVQSAVAVGRRQSACQLPPAAAYRLSVPHEAVDIEHLLGVQHVVKGSAQLVGQR